MGSVQQIDNWLNSRRDLEAGRSLLHSLAEPHGVSQVILEMVSRYTNSGTADIIAGELEEIRAKIASAARPAPKEPAMNYLRQPPAELPQKLQGLRDEVKQISIERHVLRGKSRELKSGSEELKKVALAIVRIAKRRAYIYERLDHFAKYGIELDPPIYELDEESKVATLTRWLRAKDTHPPYISKNKNSADPKILEQVARRRDELAQIKEYLDAAP